MIHIDIPGFKNLSLSHLVMDYNGTIACDGELIPELRDILSKLSDSILLHIITADTHGSVKEKIGEISCDLKIINPENQDREKLVYIQKLGCEKVVAVGNGRNDVLMLEHASLGIGIIHSEGCSSRIVSASDVLCSSPVDALNLLVRPSRLIASLRM